MVVTDIEYHAADDFLGLDHGIRRDLTRHHDQAGLGERLTCYAARSVLRDDGIEDGVGNLIGNLVRMSFGHGLGRKQI